MSWKATAWVKSLTHHPDGSPLTARQKLVLFVLADYHNDERGFAWVSTRRAAIESLTSRRWLIDILQTLESHGTVIIERRGTNTHLYRFPLVKPLHQQVAGEFTSAGEVRVHHPGEVRVHHPGEVASSPKPPLAANEPPVEREVRRVFETPEFRRFWDAYPNKLDREDAFREWMRYGWGDKDVETILAGLARWKLCEQWIENERFIPRASKFIRNRQWEINTPRKAESKSEKRQRKTSEAFDRIRKNSGANTHVD